MKKWLITFSLLIQLASAQFLNQTPPPQVKKNAAGQNIIFDYALSLKGLTTTEVSLTQYQDQPLVIFYFSSLCPHCKKAFPQVQAIYNKYKDLGVQAMAISVSYNSRPSVLQFAKNMNAKMPFTQDSASQFSKKYGVGHIPVVLLVRPDGSYLVFDHVDSQLVDLEAQLKLITSQ
jgi:peroxiredoxin